MKITGQRSSIPEQADIHHVRRSFFSLSGFGTADGVSEGDAMPVIASASEILTDRSGAGVVGVGANNDGAIPTSLSHGADLAVEPVGRETF